MTDILNVLRKHFGNLVVTRGDEYAFLGMNIKIREDKNAEIEMKDQLLEALDAFGEEVSVAVAPTTRKLWNIDDDAPLLTEEKRDIFHSVTAKLLYIIKRSRLDIEPTVAFLCTRVSKSNIEDWQKLM